MRKLWHFPGGLHLDAHKDESTGEPIAPVPLPRELIIPLNQHVGEAPEVVVKVGERVLAGQLIAKPRNYVSAAVHASSSGVVQAIGPRLLPHPSGLEGPAVVIETDGQDEWIEPLPPLPNYAELDRAELRQRVRDCGVVGLGGAAFPTSVKLNPGPDVSVDQLILNGAECEPYISCDDMLMRERAAEVIAGLRVMRYILNARECLIGIEDNKPQAVAAMRKAVADCGEAGMEVVVVPTRYPAGGGKQLLYTLTGKEAPSGGLAREVGAIVHNIGTAYSVYEAVLKGRPLTARIVTVTGAGVARPRNFEARIGTPFADLVAAAGGYTPKADRMIMGGPMMGFTVQDDAVPVIKATNCVLVGDLATFPEPNESLPCIRCGACVEVCPMSLLPQQLYWFSRSKDFEKASDHNLFDCIECGLCAYVCPSQLPLVQYYRYAKSEVWAAERERRKADIARQRHEFRGQRLEREKEEAAEKRRKKKEALSGGTAEAGDDAKKAAIEAALARAKQKKAEQASVPAPAPADTDQPR